MEELEELALDVVVFRNHILLQESFEAQPYIHIARLLEPQQSPRISTSPRPFIDKRVYRRDNFPRNKYW